ncbi:AcrB/AcrD/AcrF family protein, partial [Candidatus Fermentibacteria bacterium]
MIMVFIAFIGFGIFSLSQLGLDLFPKLEFPQIVIVSMMRGTGPEEMERLVTDVLEESVSQVMNLKNIESTSGSGSSVIFAEFEWGTDMNQAEIDIRNALDLYEDQLPEDVTDPMVIALDPSLSPIMFLSFSSDVLNEAELRYLIENDIEPLINRIDGVGSTMTRGGIEEQINVDVNPIILSEQGLSLSQLVGALSSVREDVPAGDFSFNGTYMNMKVETAFHSLEEIGRLVVGQNAGMPVQLQNVASIYRGYKDIKSIVRVDGSSSVVMVVFRRADANTVNVCGRVVDSLSEIDDSFGSAFSSSIVFSQADFINKSIMNLADTGLIALVVASLVLLFFLRSWRTSLVVAISIPVSVILCFIALRLFDITLNLISLSGLVLAVGMLVDNSIVVLENIFR